MLHSDFQYTKVRWLLAVAGLLLYVVDICTDVGLALKYFREKHFVWTGLTLGFVLVGLLVTQVFSHAWYRDDLNDIQITPEGTQTISGMSKGGLIVWHFFCMGIFTRYYQLLKQGFPVVWTTGNPCAEEDRKVHHNLFCLATDLSMLKLFESFTESAPQLLLQLYIVLGHETCSVMQYASMAFSVFKLAWALVEYRRWLRRSLPNTKSMPSGLPTAIYLLYKICTITSHVLSYSLFLILSTYSTVALTILWLLGTTWAHLLHTNFCSSRGLEFLYRAVIGFILTFTFFNVKGQDTRSAMIVYYSLYSCINISAPLLLFFLKPDLLTTRTLLALGGLIFGCLGVGLVFLVLYYLLLHPRDPVPEADEVDSSGNVAETTIRIKKCLQPC
ncbi:XK-related protein 9 [Brachionichthys hirsutus]|uniref:XK-related protein 9 n=1 Tax=Brachionichthys hirsutus TaxID=412623 RepID=UPI0036054564